jgi:hypothetical protein
MPKSAPVPGEDEAFTLPRRIKPISRGENKKRRRSGGSGGGEFFDGLPSVVYLAVVGVLGLGFLLTLAVPDAGAYVFLGGASCRSWYSSSMEWRA